MRFERVVFWLHLAAGCIAAIAILIMSVTGVALTYERQLAEWADMRHYDVGPSAEQPSRLSADALVARVRAQRSDGPLGTLTLRSSPSAPANITIGRSALYVDPYTGAVLGEGSARIREVLNRLRDWHRWLGAGPEQRAMPRAITGASNLAFLFLVVSGVYLWWPKAWRWSHLRNVLWFRRGLTPRARDFNWHNTIGFWCAVPLFIVVLSGVVISYPWASDLVYRAAGEEPPRFGPRGPDLGGGGARGTEEARPWTPARDLESLVEGATQQVPDWRTISFRVPSNEDGEVSLNVDRGTGGEPQKRATLVLESGTAGVAAWQPFSSQSRGRRWRSLMRFGHTGEYWGLAGQTIAGIASLGAAVLMWTGLALAWRRFRRWLRHRGAVEETQSTAA